LHTALTGLVLSVLFVAAIVFVHYSRLMWDDFLLMSAALLMHDRLARRIDALAASMRNWFGSHRGKPLPN
jgi:hypothetical protein